MVGKCMSINFLQFAQYPNLKYGFSVRQDGSMHRRLERSNREKYFRKIGISPDRVVTAVLAHGAKVALVSGKAAGTTADDADGLITDEKDLFLSVTAADCFILYFSDPAKNVVGIVHVGWRGLLAGIVKNIVQAMVTNFKTDTQDILVGIGPGIRKCHFEISPGDKIKYGAYPDFVLERDNKIFIDLAGIIKTQLQDNGILKEHIEDSGVCTYCEEKEYFSYRRDKPKEVQPMVGYIGLI